MASKLEYLQRYMGTGRETTEKKRRKKRVKDTTVSVGTRIVDVDHDWTQEAQPSRGHGSALSASGITGATGEDEGEDDAPVVVAGGDIDPEDLPVITNAHDFQAELQAKSTPSTRKDMDDLSPPRRPTRTSRSRNRNEDASPPRRLQQNDNRKESKKEDDDDASPPRRRPVHRDSEDALPPRRHGQASSDDDASPPRRQANKRRDDQDGDASPPRRQQERTSNPSSKRRSESPRRKNSPERRRGSSHSHRRGSSRSASPRRGTQRLRRRSPSILRERSRGTTHDRRSRSRSGDRRQSRSRDHRRRSPSGQRNRRRRSASASPEARPRHHHRSHSRSRSGSKSVSSKRASAPPASHHKEKDRPPPQNAASLKQSDDQDPFSTTEAKTNPPNQEPPKDEYMPRAGLFTATEFADDLKRKVAHNDLLKSASAQDLGHKAETVYRDKKGRKLDMLNELVRQQEIVDGKRAREAKDEYEWGTGRVQKEEKRSQKELLDKIQHAPFARGADDAELEAMRRERVRAFDPMNSKVFQDDSVFGDDHKKMSKKHKSKNKSKNKSTTKAVKNKPHYAGPPAPPNRFGVAPGYRWDGVVRGSGWEEKLMLRANTQSAQSDEAYRYAVADM